MIFDGFRCFPLLQLTYHPKISFYINVPIIETMYEGKHINKQIKEINNE